jgi:replicative DNA helicase Mcm
MKILKKISERKDLHKLMSNSYAPDIKMLHEEKLTIILALLGGNIDKRNEIHVLLAGDPGLAKSELIKFADKKIPFARYASGTSSSSVGLTAGVVKDEISGGWSLEAGVVVMANGGVACIDELDKMAYEKQNDMNECMEQQTVTINKAGVHGTLNAKTTLICALNPKLHKFYKDEDYVKQINLPHALFTRFDLVWVMIQNKSQKIELLNEIIEDKKMETISEENLIHYIFYARQLKPKLSMIMKKKLGDLLGTLINLEDTDGIGLPISITPRQILGLMRITTAFAKLRLSNIVEDCDIQSAWNLFKETLHRMGLQSKPVNCFGKKED